MKAVIVLPTYNERENIKILIPKLQKEFKKIKHNMNILVVDDSSPDKTADEVKKLQKKYKNLYLLNGQKQGLGVAYLRGFKHVINKLKADVMFMMDSDLSHPPELVSKFMLEIDKGYDIVIGSRYIKGGATPDWSLRRKIVSRGGNFFARVVGGLYKIHDCTTGFRAIRVSAFKKINLNHLHTRGYAFLSTLLYEMIATGSTTKEIPLIFRDRKYGETKLSKRDMIEFFLNAFRLRLKSTQRMRRFITIGTTGVLINLAMFISMRNVLYGYFGANNLPLLFASLFGDWLSVIYNFSLNDILTFKNKKATDKFSIRLLKFHMVALTSIIINNAILFLMHKGLGYGDVFSKLTGILIAFVFNYLANVKWTWREKI